MKIVTHSGKFHADDIFAVATLLLAYPDAEVVRSRDEEVIKSGDIVVDVGSIYDVEKKRFDHHQVGGAGVRDNSIPYASFGLVWKEWGKVITNPKAAVIIDRKMAEPIDAHDNGYNLCEYKFPGVRTYSISDFFYTTYETCDHSPEGLTKSFLQCVELAKGLLEKEIQIAERTVEDEEIVTELIESSPDKRLVVMDRERAWENVSLNYPDLLYVIHKGVEGKWKVKGVRRSTNNFDLRKPLPQAWGGFRDKELQELTGVSGAIFCHKSLFMCVAETKEGALALAQMALNQ